MNAGPDTTPETPIPAGDVREIVGIVLDAAIDAELETGEREPDPKTAKAHIVVRAVRGMAGVCVIAVGVALTVLPGPGVLLILAGLGVLAIDYPFAARLRDRLLQTGGQYAGRAGRILKRALLGLGIITVLLLTLVVLGVILMINAFG